MTFSLQYTPPTKETDKPKKPKRSFGNTIFTVRLADGTEKPFGSIAAIYDIFTVKDLGISQQGLYDFGITEKHPYSNKRCSIKKSVIHRKKGNRKRPD